MTSEHLQSTPLTLLHRDLGARMTGFAGYEMPVQYPTGIIKEHLWTRAQVGIFDVSHMGPAWLELSSPTGDGDADHKRVAALLEPLVCGDILGLRPGQMRYTLLLNEAGGIRDDLMIGRPASPSRQGTLYLVVNAGTKTEDFTAIAAAAGAAARLVRADDGALVAVQGPEAAAVAQSVLPNLPLLGFMTLTEVEFAGGRVTVSRSGYTGEDGFEILAPPALAKVLWNQLLADPRAAPIGLGARDSLRMEAGLPLYGHDVDTTTSPIEANLGFAVSKRRLKMADFPGAQRVSGELTRGPDRLRVGLRILGGAPAREGAIIASRSGEPVGKVTSGGFSPSLGAPIAMGYVPPTMAKPGQPLHVIVRGRAGDAVVTALPFISHRYFRQPKS